jgi:hypothetical protein
MTNKEEQELLSLIFEFKEAVSSENDENLLQIADCLSEIFQTNIGLLYNEQNQTEHMEFFEILINEINSKSGYDDFTIKCLYLINFLSNLNSLQIKVFKYGKFKKAAMIIFVIFWQKLTQL